MGPEGDKLRCFKCKTPIRLGWDPKERKWVRLKVGSVKVADDRIEWRMGRPVFNPMIGHALHRCYKKDLPNGETPRFMRTLDEVDNMYVRSTYRRKIKRK